MSSDILTKERDALKTVIVIGGGYAGIEIAKKLDPKASVVLIDKKPVFFHKLSSLRAAVVPGWTDIPLMPYDRLLERGVFVRGEAIDIDIDKKQVVLKSGETYEFDAAILAAGTEYPMVGHFVGDTVDDARKEFARLQSSIELAERIIVVGGGPVGFELAGEVISAYPDKELSIIHSRQSLLHSNEKTSEVATQQLRAHGVRLILGERATADGNKGVVTSTGKKLRADLIFWTIGSKPNSDWIKTTHPEWLDESGRIKVEPDLRVVGQADIYAMGDITNLAEPKLAAATAPAQANVVTANLLDDRRGSDAKAYKTPLAAYALVAPFGPDSGVTLLPIGKKGMVFGKKITRIIKGKSLFVDRWARKLHVPSAG